MQSQIIIGSTTYGPDKIIDATYTHVVNSGEQLNVGTVASAQLVIKTRESTWTVGTSLTYSNRPYGNGGIFKTIGKFIIKDITKNLDVYTYTCYDYLSKLDTIVDSWWAGLSWPAAGLELQQLFSGVATACGLQADTNFHGAPSKVKKPTFSAVNLRGRQIVQWIAQIAGGFAYAKNTGVMAIKNFSSTGVHTFSPYQYDRLDIANYTATAPDWIQVAKNNNGDVWNYARNGGVGHTGTNLIKITGNPFTWGDDYTQSAAQYCFNIIIKDLIPNYVPFTMHVFEDYEVKAGDGITINGVNTIVMSKKIDKNGVTFSAQGVKERSETTELHAQQIVYQSPQEWFDQGVTNSSEAFGTAGISIKGKGWNNLDFTASYNKEGMKVQLESPTVLRELSLNAEYGYPSLLVRDYDDPIEKYYQTIVSGDGVNVARYDYSTTTGLTKDGMNIHYDGIEFRLNNDRDYSEDVTCYIDKEATETWFTVETNVVTSEPSNYTYWSNIQYPNAIKYFVLCLTGYNSQTGETSIYASTIIPRWPNDSGIAYFGHARYLVQEGSSAADLKIYEANAKLSYGKNDKIGYKLWVSNSNYHAKLLCFY